MTLRVADCQASYEGLRSRGATFIAPPYDWGSEIRCFLRDRTATWWRSASQIAPDRGIAECPESAFGEGERCLRVVIERLYGNEPRLR